jgi:hypothetical protein
MMMGGRGVTNFSVDRPSHEFTTSTTEFDDALIQRGIVTIEQAMMAKGASPEDAVRLANEKRGIIPEDSRCCEPSPTGHNTTSTSEIDGEEDDDSFVDDEEDVFMQRYREERLQQMRETHSQPTSVEHITRDDWMAKVNEVSINTWVVVTLTDKRRDLVLQELHRIAREYDTSIVCLLTIDAADAIPNWPSERVPSMFAYRDGIKQHEWIASRHGEFPSRDIIENLFQQWGIL